MSGIEVVCLLLMLVGLAGIVVQVLPGTVLVAGALILWAATAQSGLAWVLAVVALLVLAGAEVLKYVLAGRRLKRAEIPGRTMLLGGVAGVIGFFVVPVVGLPLFFVLAVLLLEWLRLRDRRGAWVATKEALKAAGTTLLVDLAGALVAVTVWAIGVVLT